MARGPSSNRLPAVVISPTRDSTRRKELGLAEKWVVTQMFSRHWTNCMMEELSPRRIFHRGIRRSLPRLRTNNHKSHCSPAPTPVHFDKGLRVHQWRVAVLIQVKDFLHHGEFLARFQAWDRFEE